MSKIDPPPGIARPGIVTVRRLNGQGLQYFDELEIRILRASLATIASADAQVLAAMTGLKQKLEMIHETAIRDLESPYLKRH